MALASSAVSSARLRWQNLARSASFSVTPVHQPLRSRPASVRTMASIQKVAFGESQLPGYEIGDKSLPAVILLQEWWGITDLFKKQAELLSSRGFRVLCPDLYKGKVGVTAEEAHHLMSNLDFKGAVGEIGQAAKYLLETGSPKVGITGMCMGGALSFASAQHIKDLTCAAPCYGIPDARYFQVEQIKIPLLGIFGALDSHKGFSDEATARATAEKIKAAGGDITLEVYPSGVHGFLNQLILPEGPTLTKERQGSIATDEDLHAAWEAIVAFFTQHLK